MRISYQRLVSRNREDLEGIPELLIPVRENVAHVGLFPSRFNDIAYQDDEGTWVLYLYNDSILCKRRIET